MIGLDCPNIQTEEYIMGDGKVTGCEDVLEELVLRGKVPGIGFCEEERDVLVHILWGKYESEQVPAHEGFGLQMEDDGGWSRRIPDISTDPQEICSLAERMNRYHVSRYHFDDVVADFLAVV